MVWQSLFPISTEVSALVCWSLEPRGPGKGSESIFMGTSSRAIKDHRSINRRANSLQVRLSKEVLVVVRPLIGRASKFPRPPVALNFEI